ncbi:hypothetical protein [Halorhabdus rudnickae]|uniref:hypothetical protein n=1 Tax=Halorhabdus rudnickae TaxID=1775544 RepID=UPI001AF00894|nr:hypothetical protein [Halorhabdus rudnickae]
MSPSHREQSRIERIKTGVSNLKRFISSDLERKTSHLSLKVTVVGLFLSALVQPAAAQSGGTSICDVEFVSSVINALFSLAIGGALVLGILTWVLTSFTESLPLPQSTKQSVKKQRNSGLASALRAVVVPAIIVTILSATSIGIPSCISVMP